MNNLLIKTPYFVIQKLIFELVKPVSWKKICLKYFSLQKIDKNTTFVQKQQSEVFLKKEFSKLFSKLKEKHLGFTFLIKIQASGLQL